MSDQLWPESWRLVSRARGVGLLLRVFIVFAPMVALVCTRVAAAETLAAIEVAVVGAAVLAAIAPDSHVGLLVVLLVGVGWWASVDDHTTPWSIGVAASLAVFHASAAAASVVPPSAAWTMAMCRRWLLRCWVVVGGSAVTWVVVWMVHSDDRAIGGGAVTVVVALVLVGAGALWARGASADPLTTSLTRDDTRGT